jgi:hypothetical protein
MKEIVRVKSAPGLKWKKRTNDLFEARWQCRDDIVKKGFKIKSVKLWSGRIDPTLEEWDFISDTCSQLQQEMLVWSRGGLPYSVAFSGTISGLIHCYKNDPDSTFRKPGGLRYNSRIHYDALMSMIEREHGHDSVCEIRARTFLRWHENWIVGGKVAVAHAKIGMLRTLFTFGTTILEDPDCGRLSGVLSKMRFPMPKPRNERLTATQAVAIRAKAHEMGRPSIALAQAFQFELMLRQKDVIGEWVPIIEPGMSDMIADGLKWLRGIRWEEIDENLVLTHVTSKRQKEITVNLNNAPMVLEELALVAKRPASGPIIMSEWDSLPWTGPEFRRWWRIVAEAAGVPKTVRNMDSRAGAISEATDAGADLEHVRHAATHSNISMTQRYSRGAEEKIAQVQKIRVESRNKSRTDKA